MKLRLLSILLLMLLLALPALAQETDTPESLQTPGLDEPVPVEVLQGGNVPGTNEDRYLATLDRLVSLVESVITFLPVGSLGSLLLVMVGALYVIVRLTPTKKDDEIVERLWKKVEERFFNNLPTVNASAQRMADKYAGYTGHDPNDGLMG